MPGADYEKGDAEGAGQDGQNKQKNVSYHNRIKGIGIRRKVTVNGSES